MSENWLNRAQRINQINAYCTMVKDRLNQGWTGSILTLMFNHLRGSPDSVRLQMRETAQQVYSAILKKMVRRPRSPGAVRPLLIGCPDFPVFKHHQKQLLCDIRPNDGLHWNGILLAPPDSRLKTSVAQYFTEKQQQFVADNLRQYFSDDCRVLIRVHTEPFDPADVDDVTGYVLKSLKNFRTSHDDISVFPLSRVERNYRQNDHYLMAWPNPMH
jgi:hypothetical protein